MDSFNEIPKLCHFVWITSKRRPREHQKGADLMFKKHHPDWEVKIWYRDEVEELDMVCRKEYDRCLSPVVKADIARLEVLRNFGGLYLDLDIETFGNINRFLENKKMIVTKAPWSPPVNNACMASVRDSKFVNKCLDLIGKKFWNPDFKTMLSQSGPFIIWEAANSPDLVLNQDFSLSTDDYYQEFYHLRKEEVIGKLLHKTTGSWVHFDVKNKFRGFY